jgi:hypothetical protein
MHSLEHDLWAKKKQMSNMNGESSGLEKNEGFLVETPVEDPEIVGQSLGDHRQGPLAMQELVAGQRGIIPQSRKGLLEEFQKHCAIEGNALEDEEEARGSAMFDDGGRRRMRTGSASFATPAKLRCSLYARSPLFRRVSKWIKRIGHLQRRNAFFSWAQELSRESGLL